MTYTAANNFVTVKELRTPKENANISKSLKIQNEVLFSKYCSGNRQFHHQLHVYELCRVELPQLPACIMGKILTCSTEVVKLHTCQVL